MHIPNILNYDNYREFLKDLFIFKKDLSGKYSYRKFAKDLGFKASNYLHLVLTNKRNLSMEAINKIKSHIKWNAQEKKYFENLVFLNQTNNEKEKERRLKNLQNILGKRRSLLNKDQYTYFSKWYIPVIREMLTLRNFVSSLNWISKKLEPRIEEKKVLEAIRILERLKMVAKEKGKWKQTEEHLTTGTEVTSDMIYDYHKEVLGLSLNALNLFSEKRDISSLTMSLSQKQFEWLKQKIIDFRDEIQQELQGMNEDPNLIIQLNIQLFPVTKS